MPFTQEQLGDVLGLMPVHVNRMPKQLREDGLIVQHRRRMSFPDRDELARVADLADIYLRLNSPGGVEGGAAIATDTFSREPFFAPMT